MSELIPFNGVLPTCGDDILLIPTLTVFDIFNVYNCRCPTLQQS